MQKFTHKYVFYFFPFFCEATNSNVKSCFMFFGRVRDGKDMAKRRGCAFDYQKLY